MPYRYQADATEHQRQWRENNRERYNELARLRRSRDREGYNQYMREYNALNRERVNQQAAESYKRNRERALKGARDYYQRNREAVLNYDAMRRADPVAKKLATKRARRWKDYARACRQDLRSLVEQLPTVAKALGVPNLESATDGQVRRFYDNMMEQLKHGDFNVTYDDNRKNTRSKAAAHRAVRGSRAQPAK